MKFNEDKLNIESNRNVIIFGGGSRTSECRNLSTPKKQERSSNFELLRIICMLMIICGHLIQMHSYDELFDESWYIGYAIYPFCVVAVDVFVLISGWFGIKLYYKKLLGINWMVTFYAVIILLFSLALGYKALNLRTDWMPFIPIITKQYWFITVYIVLCLISPFLNKLVEILDKRTFQKLLLILFVLFSLLPSAAFVFNFKSVTEDAGYGIVNFMFLYLLGRYLR